MEQNTSGQQEQPKRPSPVAGLIPKGEYFFTPIIININILVFVLMVLNGASITAPSPEIVLKWGANARYLTMNGEWWRLVTAMFLHYGILHITMNMYALFSIGRMLEPFIGKWRFLALYMASGIAGSVASIWWHDGAASAGASGAIMGTIGILGALATTNLIRQEIRMSLLKNIGISLLLTLGLGFSGIVDNAGHIGGLIGGAIGGYLIYFELRNWYAYHKKQYLFLGIAVLLIAGLCTGFWMITPKGINVDQLLENFNTEDKAAVVFSRTINEGTSPDQIRSQLVVHWENCAAIADSLSSSDNLSDKGIEYVEKLKSYSAYRVSGSQYIYRAISENRADFNDSAKVFMDKANALAQAIKNVPEDE